MSTRKTALVLDPLGDVSRKLQSEDFRDWDFRYANRLEEAISLLSPMRSGVGIVVFDPEEATSEQSLEPLLADTCVEWVAVLPPCRLEQPDFRRFIGRNFHDFHTLPLDNARFSMTIGHAHGKSILFRSANTKLEEAGRFGMTGHSVKMRDLYRQIDKLLNVNAPVLIGGESGSGKELVATAIHRYSNRASRPFVAMNCAALPQSLMLSELFGHEKGAFTGAHKRKVGHIEAAAGGILFLDEIGDMPLEVQSYLLRFLQEGTIVRIGGVEQIPLDVRVIAATHVNLRRAVEAGRFREDLYYRLNVLHVEVPPLRQRITDLPLLANTIFDEHFRQKNPRVKGFGAAALGAMAEHRWPGNVRELKNRVQQAMVMSENRLISPADLGLASQEPHEHSHTLDEARATLDRDIIERSLLAHGKNLSKVARQLGVSRVTLYKMIDRLNIVL